MDPKPNPAPLSDQRSFNPGGKILWGFFRYKRIDGRVRIRPVWGRFAIGFAVLCIGGWLALATAAWSFVTFSRKVPDVSFFDIVLPNRWDVYQFKRGNDYVARAKAAQDQGNLREAFQLYRVGLGKSPSNVPGRMQFASMLASANHPHISIDILEQGLEYGGNDPAYLTALFQLLLANQSDERVIELAEEKLAVPGQTSEIARIAALSAASASVFRGYYDQAGDYLDRFGLLRTNEGRLVSARLDFESGHPGVAILRLNQLATDLPHYEDAHATRFGYLRELKRANEAQSAAVLWSVTLPESIRAKLALLYSLHDAGEKERLGREVETLLAEFARQPRLMPVIAEFAINTADVPLADRIRGMATNGPFIAGLGALVAIEARVAAKDYAGALAVIEQIDTDQPEWLERHAGTLSGLRAIALYGTGKPNPAEIQLNESLRRGGLRAENLIGIAKRLQAAGAVGAARRVFEQAAADSRNQAALASLIEIDLELGNLGQVLVNAERLLKMRKSPDALLRRVREGLGSDRLLFSKDRNRVVAQLTDVLDRRRPAPLESAAAGPAS